MDRMIKRVAIAIHAADKASHYESSYEAMARAAIEAMRDSRKPAGESFPINAEMTIQALKNPRRPHRNCAFLLVQTTARIWKNSSCASPGCCPSSAHRQSLLKRAEFEFPGSQPWPLVSFPGPGRS
jgi:hypothetical protein